jgi:uncharacterized protein HemY
LLSNSARSREAKQLRELFFETCSRALERLPAPADRTLSMGRLYDVLGCFVLDLDRRRDAAQLFRESLKVNPSDAVPAGHLARILAERPDRKPHDPVEAAALAKKTIEIAPESSDSWSTLGFVRYHAGDWSAAAEALEKAAALQAQDNASDWLFLAMARWKLGQKAPAARWYQKASTWIERNHPRDQALQNLLAQAKTLIDTNRP